MKLTNTLSGVKEEFAPAGDEVHLYVCGVTPYDDVHVGHAMSYIIFDVLRRYLEWRGQRVRHVQNFTDIDDKMIRRAQERGIEVAALADEFIGAYFRDMDALNIARAHLYPRATEEIPGIIDMIRALEGRGFAYATVDGVYFRVDRFAGYGKLSHRTLEGMVAGARIEVDEAKEHPMDFALWKAAKPGEPAWDSPWGRGRPGWHIECSAMATRHLGMPLDIHGGGPDLIFPHHENEIAQTEAAGGEAPFARFWIHHGMLQLSGEKMSKSVGNIVRVREVLERHTADALRLFVLGAHYRSPLTYGEAALEAMERGAERLRTAAGRDADQGVAPAARGAAGSVLADGAARYREHFVAALEDDLNTAQAVATLFDLAREINRGRERGGDVLVGRALLRELAGVLGLTLAEPHARADADRAASFIELLLETRASLRAAKHFADADRIRERLLELGIAVEDGAQGSGWRRQREA